MSDDSTTKHIGTAAAPRPATEDDAIVSDDLPPAAAGVSKEHGGPKGLEPTRYGDWERNGRCYDF